ncbi:hypothetical protein AB4254_08045 [Vibrio breoganii]
MITKMLKITNSQADKLPESNAIATTPNHEEFYIDTETASELYISDYIAELVPEYARLAEDAHIVILHL